MKKKVEMREQMPETAAVVDWMRGFLGPVAADQIIRKGMAGQGGFWAQERGPDGVVREFGSRLPDDGPKPVLGA